MIGAGTIVTPDAKIEAEIQRLADERSAWLDRLMKFYLPPALYQAGKERKRPKRIARWLEKYGYHIREVPSQHLTEFCRGEQVLAEFRIEFKG